MKIYIDGKLATQEEQENLSKAIALGKAYIIKISFDENVYIETQTV